MCQSIWQPCHFKYGGNKDPEGFISKGKKTKNKKLEMFYFEFCIFVIHL